MPTGSDLSGRALVFAPVGRDAALLASAAIAKGIDALPVTSAEAFAEAFREGCGAAILTEEALHEDRLGRLRAVVGEQPSWSEVPFVVLTSRGQADERVRLTVSLMSPLRNVTVLERPVHPSTIVTALEAALRDRRRQYEVRDAMEALHAANADLERRVAKRTADLVAKIAELEGFCYSVSHDMRTPLRAIVSNAAVVLEEEGERVSPEGRNHLARLSAAAIRMGRLIDDLLQYARLGGESIRREPCDLSEIARRVADESLREHGLPSSTVRIAPGLVAQGDPRMLGLVLQNLIGNALKYQPPGQAPTVEVGQAPDGAFFVRDDGIGFDMRYAGKLFEPFQRLHRDGDYQGTGIGLANVRRIVGQHGGRAWAESEPGKGATFWFTLA